MAEAFTPGDAGRLTRRALLRAAAAGVAATVAVGTGARRARGARPQERWRFAPFLLGLTITNGARPFAGDNRGLATVGVNEMKGRRGPQLRFELSRGAELTTELVQTERKGQRVIARSRMRLRGGRHRLSVRLPRRLDPGTYFVRLSVRDGKGRTRVYGARRTSVPGRERAPIVRVLGVEASCDRRSYAPGQQLRLTIDSDARSLGLRVFRSGPEQHESSRRNELRGVPVDDGSQVAWPGAGQGPSQVLLGVGEWPTGVYFVRIATADGQVGFAPFIVRSPVLGTHRTAVVLPTNTWQAYNFHDADRDGYADTWYAGGSPRVVLDRPFTNRGVPPKFHRYDLAFLRWLAHTGKPVEYLSDEDLERFGDGEGLRAHYDLVIFPGHTEYVTKRAFDIVAGYRRRGGNLMFLSANNLFWKVDRRRGRLRRVALWRDLGRPEARVIGSQYLANDDGSRQQPFVVTGADTAPWFFEGTGLTNGSTFGSYGIEIDARTSESPPGTIVLATIPDLFGPGRTAEMTYHETEAGARVFAAGVIAFGGSARRRDVAQLLENLWARMAPPG